MCHNSKSQASSGSRRWCRAHRHPPRPGSRRSSQRWAARGGIAGYWAPRPRAVFFQPHTPFLWHTPALNPISRRAVGGGKACEGRQAGGRHAAHPGGRQASAHVRPGARDRQPLQTPCVPRFSAAARRRHRQRAPGGGGAGEGDPEEARAAGGVVAAAGAAGGGTAAGWIRCEGELPAAARARGVAAAETMGRRRRGGGTADERPGAAPGLRSAAVSRRD